MDPIRPPRAQPVGGRPARRASAFPARRISDAELEDLYRAFFLRLVRRATWRFLDRGEDEMATAEILAALPIIDELKMVPEGLAALSLLRESLRQQKVNRAALPDLHGYFEERKSQFRFPHPSREWRMTGLRREGFRAAALRFGGFPGRTDFFFT